MQLHALYCLIYFYYSTKTVLAPINPVGKFMAIKMIVFFTFWQACVRARARSRVLARVCGFFKARAGCVRVSACVRATELARASVRARACGCLCVSFLSVLAESRSLDPSKPGLAPVD